ncbi:hypothetical protein [Amycolatopsis nigrescens]|uniref:hypothetical protein n=1 Tax=Amycolatopsis nigrescens TaxID=381445 RepID=UPI00035CD297|nr:hypothetical protein [Amycolatopsis nigrescens]
MDSGWQELTAARFLRALRLATLGITLAVLFFLILPWFPARAGIYRSFAVELAAFSVLIAITLVVGVFLWRRWPLGRWRWILTGLVLAAAVAALVGAPPARLSGDAGWSIRAVGWVLLLLLLDYSVQAVGLFLAVHVVLSFGYVIGTGHGGRLVLAELLLASILPVAFQLAVAMGALWLRRVSVTAARTAQEQEEVRTGHAVAEQLHRDRGERYAQLATSVVPLLDGLASGRLDPGDEGVRTECAIEAARMRRLFAESDDVSDPLLHELNSCLGTAERKGLAVALAVRGQRPQLAKAVRRELTEPVIAVLAAARSGVRVTVVGSPEKVIVSVIANAPADAVPGRGNAGVTVSGLERAGRVWVEARWERNNP